MSARRPPRWTRGAEPGGPRSAARPCTLAQAHAAAVNLADREFVADERVERDPAGDEVAAVMVGVERRIEARAHLGVDEGERAAGPARWERPAPSDVAVAVEAATG
jgi:hypothetical protein